MSIGRLDPVVNNDERRLVSPSDAVRAKLAETPDPRGNPCSECKRWPARWFEFQHVVAVKMMFLPFSFADREIVPWWVCRNCAIKAGLKAQGANLLLGWWSPTGFVMNLYALGRNSVELIRSLKLGRPSVEARGPIL